MLNDQWGAGRTGIAKANHNNYDEQGFYQMESIGKIFIIGND